MQRVARVCQRQLSYLLQGPRSHGVQRVSWPPTFSGAGPHMDVDPHFLRGSVGAWMLLTTRLSCQTNGYPSVFRAPVGVISSEYHRCLFHHKTTESLAIVLRCLRDSTCCRLDTTLARDRQTDGQTDTRWQPIPRTYSVARAKITSEGLQYRMTLKVTQGDRTICL